MEKLKYLKLFIKNMEEKNDTMKFFGVLKNSKTISYIEKEVEKFRKISRVI